jgi:hypothetical protein
MIKKSLAVILTGALFIGCTYHQPAPTVDVTKPANSFDRSWAASVGALEDQGVRITSKDRSSGIVRGTRNGIDVTAFLKLITEGNK